MELFTYPIDKFNEGNYLHILKSSIFHYNPGGEFTLEEYPEFLDRGYARRFICISKDFRYGYIEVIEDIDYVYNLWYSSISFTRVKDGIYRFNLGVTYVGNNKTSEDTIQNQYFVGAFENTKPWVFNTDYIYYIPNETGYIAPDDSDNTLPPLARVPLNGLRTTRVTFNQVCTVIPETLRAFDVLQSLARGQGFVNKSLDYFTTTDVNSKLYHGSVLYGSQTFTSKIQDIIRDKLLHSVNNYSCFQGKNLKITDVKFDLVKSSSEYYNNLDFGNYVQQFIGTKPLEKPECTLFSTSSYFVADDFIFTVEKGHYNDVCAKFYRLNEDISTIEYYFKLGRVNYFSPAIYVVTFSVQNNIIFFNIGLDGKEATDYQIRYNMFDGRTLLLDRSNHHIMLDVLDSNEFLVQSSKFTRIHRALMVFIRQCIHEIQSN